MLLSYALESSTIHPPPHCCLHHDTYITYSNIFNNLIIYVYNYIILHVFFIRIYLLKMTQQNTFFKNLAREKYFDLIIIIIFFYIVIILYYDLFVLYLRVCVLKSFFIRFQLFLDKHSRILLD